MYRTFHELSDQTTEGNVSQTFIFTLQSPFSELRHQEKVSLRKSGYAQSLAIACGPVVPVVAAILTFLGVILSGNDLLASEVCFSFYI